MSKKPLVLEVPFAGILTNVATIPTGGWRIWRPVINYDRCKRCWTCVDYCPEGVIAKADEGPKIDYNYCKGCGICEHECPFKAVEMVRELRR
jgi:pyruvate ferredoxin oxidoreductase delta subunit